MTPGHKALDKVFRIVVFDRDANDPKLTSDWPINALVPLAWIAAKLAEVSLTSVNTVVHVSKSRWHSQYWLTRVVADDGNLCWHAEVTLATASPLAPARPSITGRDLWAYVISSS